MKQEGHKELKRGQNPSFITCLKCGFKWLFTEELKKKNPLWDKGDEVGGESTGGQLEAARRDHLGTAQVQLHWNSPRGDHSIQASVVNSCYLLLILAFRGTGEKKICLSMTASDHSARKSQGKNGSDLQVQVSSKMW